MVDKYYSTHKVAKMFGVTSTTVVNWVKRGRLRAHRTEGGHRRISSRSVVAYARAEGLPIPGDVLDGGKLKVLVVDDDPDFCDMVRDYLEAAEGLVVRVAISGFEAGYSVAKFRPDLILMDIMMPHMNGFEVHDRLKNDAATAHIPLIACTAYGDAQLESEIQSRSFDGYIQKPLRLEHLLEMIRERFTA